MPFLMDFTGARGTIVTVNVLRRVSTALLISALLGTSVAIASRIDATFEPLTAAVHHA